jgi:transcription antitermination factor NusG
MAKGWYVVHTYSGYENKVQKHVRMLVDKGGLKDRIFDVKVPAEEVVEVKDGRKRVTSKKFLPGYILVDMDLPDQGWKETCMAIRAIPGVTGFVGSNRNQKPQSISQEEARRAHVSKARHRRRASEPINREDVLYFVKPPKWIRGAEQAARSRKEVRALRQDSRSPDE